MGVERLALCRNPPDCGRSPKSPLAEEGTRLVKRPSPHPRGQTNMLILPPGCLAPYDLRQAGGKWGQWFVAQWRIARKEDWRFFDSVIEWGQAQLAVLLYPNVAVAVMNRSEFLLTWNCEHLANAGMRSNIEAACRELGYEAVIICTPEELTEV